MQAVQPVRAILGNVQNKPSSTALAVYTTDITRIFDDVDLRLVEGCAMCLRIVAQERSLQDALQARERFMRGITHQLRTPLHGILGSVDLLADEVSRDGQDETSANPKGATVLETLRTIKSSGRELISTVNNIIKFNRWAESVHITKVANLTDLNKLESEILEDIFFLLPEEHYDRISIFFSNNIPTEVEFVQIDMTLLKDCLQSLILNALQSTVRGHVIITMSVASDYSSVIFDVEDTGRGIALVDQRRIFDAYEKGDVHSTGAGLGLTLACKIAQALSGTVELVSSTLGEGSHFRAEFSNPGLACPRQRAISPITILGDLTDRFSLIPSDPPSTLDQRFTRFLKIRGLQSSDKVACALAVVSYTHLSDQYHKLLHLAAKSLIAISLVPRREDLSAAKKDYPNILFFSGPFTTDRLDEILMETRNICISRRPPPAQEQTSSAESGTSAKTSHGTIETPLSLPLRRRSSTVPRDSIPYCLLVDDNLINLRIMRKYCDKREFPYRTALDGLQAIDEYKAAVEETPISLILLDLQMPNCDGIQACEKIRALEAEEDLQPAVVFIVTGQDSPSDRKRSFAAGADRFFVKPLALKSLDRGIAEFFGKVP